MTILFPSSADSILVSAPEKWLNDCELKDFKLKLVKFFICFKILPSQLYQSGMKSFFMAWGESVCITKLHSVKIQNYPALLMLHLRNYMVLHS